ncbi:MAG TPA: DUF1990 family protein [Fimbriimonadaceae bacterium]|nr:DUF1990 family protein [Fimbriimonadaceae bacterium]
MDLIQRAENATRNWDPVAGGKRAWICFEDDETYDLGADPDGVRFEEIARRMLSGDYYPPDAVRFDGRFRREGRELRSGDRVVQQAPLLGRLGGPLLPSAAEIYVAEKHQDQCKLGYVTTTIHFGRGIWTAELTRAEGRLSLRVWSIASPRSWLFWLGLPYARYLQLRARRRAVEEFRKPPKPLPPASSSPGSASTGR